MPEHDLVVIGSGSGLDVASVAARQGMDVAVIEDGPMGGTCLNRGCIPSKMLIHRADIAENIRRAEAFGIDAEMHGVDFQGITAEVSAEVDSDAESIRRGIEKSDQHTLYKGEGRFTGEKTLEVDGTKVAGEKIVVAAGTRPVVPPIEGLEDVDYMTSKAALRREEQPEHLVIIGGGYIAAELAHFYGALGTDITIIEMTDTLIGNEDRQIRERFMDAFAEKYDILLGHKASKVEQNEGTITVTAEDADGETADIEGDALLVAVGRRPNTDRLAVEEAGIETDENGFIETNERMETSVDGVWALGDIAGNWMFKHSANLEAGIVARNALMGQDVEVDYTAMPHAIFSSPQVAGVGKTSQELDEEGVPYLKGVYEYENTGMGAALKEEDGFVKVLASTDGEILGCHIMGPHASILVHEVLVAMRHGSGTLHDIIDTVHIHPALNEVVQRAFNRVH